MSRVSTYTDKLPGAVAEQLRAEKAAAEISYQDIADRLGVHQQTVIRYFKGTRDIPLSVIVKLAELFEVTPSELLSRAVERIK